MICHFSMAQNNENFYKSMILEGFKIFDPLHGEQLLNISKEPDNQDSTTVSQNLRKKLLLYSSAYFMYDNSKLKEDFDEFLKENKHLNLPEELTQKYTNYKPKYYETYDNSRVFVDGRWVEKSSLVSAGGGFSLSDLFKFKSAKQKRKEKALKNITENIYPTE